MEEITSASNSRVKRLVLLRQKAKERRQSQSFVIEGERLVLDAPAEYLEEVYVTREAMEKAGERLAPFAGKLTLLSDEAMAKASDTMSPQGILDSPGILQRIFSEGTEREKRKRRFF